MFLKSVVSTKTNFLNFTFNFLDDLQIVLPPTGMLSKQSQLSVEMWVFLL